MSKDMEINQTFRKSIDLENTINRTLKEIYTISDLITRMHNEEISLKLKKHDPLRYIHFRILEFKNGEANSVAEEDADYRFNLSEAELMMIRGFKEGLIKKFQEEYAEMMKGDGDA